MRLSAMLPIMYFICNFSVILQSVVLTKKQINNKQINFLADQRSLFVNKEPRKFFVRSYKILASALYILSSNVPSY